MTYEVLLVASDAEAYDRFYNVIANPILWFIQHYLWDLSNAPDIRREEAEAWELRLQGRQHGHRALPCWRAIEGDDEPLVMFHDYHLYTCPGLIRVRAPDAFLHHFVHIPWSQPDSWRILPAACARRSTAGCSPTTSSASTPPPTAATSCTAAGS